MIVRLAAPPDAVVSEVKSFTPKFFISIIVCWLLFRSVATMQPFPSDEVVKAYITGFSVFLEIYPVAPTGLFTSLMSSRYKEFAREWGDDRLYSSAWAVALTNGLWYMLSFPTCLCQRSSTVGHSVANQFVSTQRVWVRYDIVRDLTLLVTKVFVWCYQQG